MSWFSLREEIVCSALDSTPRYLFPFSLNVSEPLRKMFVLQPVTYISILVTFNYLHVDDKVNQKLR
jgi:hypothetical protein